MSKTSFPRRYRFPLEIVEDVRLEKPVIDLRNEDLLLELYDVLLGEAVTGTAAPEDDISPEDAALAKVQSLVGGEGIESLEGLLAAYTAHKRFFRDVLRKAEAQSLQRVGKSAAGLIDAIEKARQPSVQVWLGISAAELTGLVETLRRLEAATGFEGSFEKYLFPFDDDLLLDLIDWWNAATDADPSFWSRDEETHSSFVRFAKAVIGLLPEDVHPTGSKGTTGFSRNALKRRHDKALQDRHRREKGMELLRRLASDPPSSNPE